MEVEVIMKTDIIAEKGYEYYTVRDPITKLLTICRKRYVYRHYPATAEVVTPPVIEVKPEEVNPFRKLFNRTT